MPEIILLSGEKTLIDIEDIDLIVFKWSYNKRDNCASFRINKKFVYLSRIIGRRMGFSESLEIDHKNTDSLDNRRENLRSATRLQNGANRNLQINNTSGYKGVYFHKQNGKWIARIKEFGRNINLGSYKTPEEAAIEYNNAAKRLYGEFACLNPI